MEFKDRIRNRRLELGLTLDEVARIVGVSNATISRWESGVIENQRRDKVELLAKALRLSPGELMGWPRNGSETTSSQDAALLQLFHQLNEDGQQKVVTYAEDLVSSGKYEQASPRKVV